MGSPNRVRTRKFIRNVRTCFIFGRRNVVACWVGGHDGEAEPDMELVCTAVYN